jgi:hypothetical protein
MSFTITRSQLVTRVRNIAHEQANSGPYEDASIIAHLQYAIEELWSDLTKSEDGVGRIHQNFIIGVTGPGGASGTVPFAPGPSIPMPPDLAVLVAVRRNGVRLIRGTPDRREFALTFTGSPAPSTMKYWIDGPNQYVNSMTGALGLTPATLLTIPDWALNDVVEWLYIQKPPLLLDPTDVTPPVIEVTLDLLEAAIVQAIVALAVTGITARGDVEALQRAKAEAQRVIANYFKCAHDRDRGVQMLSDFAPERPSLAWWR